MPRCATLRTASAGGFPLVALMLQCKMLCWAPMPAIVGGAPLTGPPACAQLNSTLHCVSVIVLVRVPLDPNRAPTRRLAGMEYYAERRLKGLGLLDDSGNTTWDGFFKDSIA